jgi:hypothetical protein
MKYLTKFNIRSNQEDCEKAVLPAIVFINTNHASFKNTRRKGFFIFIGWWHWSIRVGIIKK